MDRKQCWGNCEMATNTDFLSSDCILNQLFNKRKAADANILRKWCFYTQATLRHVLQPTDQMAKVSPKVDFKQKTISI